ncbi:hypothetical protein C8R46DRAFT_329714, partial [Mycena filopes]
MSQQTEEGQLNQDGYSNSETEAAAAKLWTVYVSEAEKYDKSLVESWKSDMEGMLIFAGLFSASLTAFLIESYKTLVPDSGDTTVLLLAQISQQLAASSNGTAFDFVPPAPFTPLVSSLVCNVLWFISLGLSLTCALVATLLEQWARDFLHKTEIRSAPVIRARVFSYLYYGLKRFGMHRVVETIPLLLHTSLFFFFAGLVAFLIPIHILVMAVAAVILGMVTLVYTILTLLPLSYWDCPYRTSLSGVFWNLQSFIHRLLPGSPQGQDKIKAGTMMDGLFGEATKQSAAQNLRDERALLWTIKSLTDDNELEPLLKAIPDVLWGTNQRRWLYDGHIYCLISNSDLLSRLHAFGHNSNSGVVSLEVANQRQMTYYKTIWALGTLSVPGYAVKVPVLPCSRESSPEIYPYYISAEAVQGWVTLREAKGLIDRTMSLLMMCAHEVEAPAEHPTNMESTMLIGSCLKELESLGLFSFNGAHYIPSMGALPLAARDIACEVTGLPLRRLLDYLVHAARLKTIPYQFETTLVLLSPLSLNGFKLPRQIFRDMEYVLEIVLLFNLNELKEASEKTWLDTIFCKILSYWEPQEPKGTLPLALLVYIASRKCQGAISNTLLSVTSRAWRQIPETILSGPSNPWKHDWGDALTAILTTVHSLCSRYPHFIQTEYIDLATWEAILVAVSQTKHEFLTPSVVAVVKRAALDYIYYRNLDTLAGTDLILLFDQHVLLAPLDVSDPRLVEPQEDEETRMRTILRYRYLEEELNSLTDFLQQCCSKGLLFKASYTMWSLGNFQPRPGIWSCHQLRFGTVVKDLFAKGDEELLDRFISLAIWDVYTNPSDPSEEPWLDDAEACSLLQETFTKYSETLPAHNKLLPAIRRLMSSLELLHSAQNTGDQNGNESVVEISVGDEHVDLD